MSFVARTSPRSGPTFTSLVSFTLFVGLASAACDGRDTTDTFPDQRDPGGTDDCQGGVCVVPLDSFDRCARDYETELASYAASREQGCTAALFDCEGVRAVGYVYGFTGDNYQCFYDDQGALVGGYLTRDHGFPDRAGEVPSTACFPWPIDCSDAGAVADAGSGPDAASAPDAGGDAGDEATGDAGSDATGDAGSDGGNPADASQPDAG